MKKMYSTMEAAKILQLSRIQVFRKIRDHQIKAEKVGRNYVIKHSVLMEALRKKTIMEALSKNIGPIGRNKIESAVRKAVKEYAGTFKRLAEE